MWQWRNYVVSNVEQGNHAVVLNLDETSVPFHQGERKGNAVARQRHYDPDTAAVQRLTRRELRACVTHVAIVADDAEVQAALPQEVLGNKSVLLVCDLRVVGEHLPANVRVVRANS